MIQKKRNFKDELIKGQAGEEIFHTRYSAFITRTDGLKGDFIIKTTGQRIELKTDHYPYSRTPNFFIERYSNSETKTPGGPWQALQNGCQFYAYYYIKGDVLYIFDTQKLCNFFDSITSPNSPIQLIYVPNDTHTTMGYKVTRRRVCTRLPYRVWGKADIYET